MKRQVLQHEAAAMYEDFDPDNSYNIDTPIDTIQAFALNRGRGPLRSSGPPRVLMPRDKWFALDQESKETWDKLSEKAKGIILGTVDVPKESFRLFQRNNNRTPFKPKHQENLHQISAFDYFSNIRPLLS